MRRLMTAAIAAAGFAGAGLLAVPAAQALPLSTGGIDFQNAKVIDQVVLVCPRPRWSGFAWVQPPCYNTYPAPVYVAPPPYVVRRPWRRRVYVY